MTSPKSMACWPIEATLTILDGTDARSSGKSGLVSA